MRNLLLFAVLVILPLLLGGCGEKDEVTDETKPKLKSVNYGELEQRESIWYLKGLDTPYTGKSFRLYDNGQKLVEGNYKDGKPDGLRVQWNEVGQKEAEINFKDGKENGLLTRWYNNGQKKYERNYKDGYLDDLSSAWHKNGQKRREVMFKDGELISEKWWNNRGEPVDSYSEAIK